ncbi:MAG: hypothetical protein QY319_05050 [Candidatus Kapaibacterium sp.]|nr:MAG: hypothetical protein QY319_05050 [Candidatus Kapabacteria bacterium]
MRTPLSVSEKRERMLAIIATYDVMIECLDTSSKVPRLADLVEKVTKKLEVEYEDIRRTMEKTEVLVALGQFVSMLAEKRGKGRHDLP